MKMSVCMCLLMAGHLRALENGMCFCFVCGLKGRGLAEKKRKAFIDVLWCFRSSILRQTYLNQKSKRGEQVSRLKIPEPTHRHSHAVFSDRDGEHVC